MRKIIISLVLVVLSFSMFAQDDSWRRNYKDVYSLHNDYYIVVNKKNLHGLVDKQGNEVITPSFKKMLSEQPECGVLGVSLDGKKWGYINVNGEVIVPFLYERVYSFSENCGVIYDYKKSAMVDITGKIIVPFVFDIISPMHEGLAEIVNWCYFDPKAKSDVEFIGGKHGLIDATGKVIAPLEYDEIYDFAGNVAKFEINQLFGLMDSSGKMMLRPICKEIGAFNSKGLAECLVYDRWVYVDTVGKFGKEVPGKNKPKRPRYPVDKKKLDAILAKNMALVKVSENANNKCPVLPQYGDYYISKFEITFGLFEIFLNAPDDRGDGYITSLERKDDPNSVEKLLSGKINRNLPVYNVSWKDCSEFCYWLSGIMGCEYALPTEAEWEYAARGGEKSKGFSYAGSNNTNDVAWYKDNGKNKCQQVGIKSANELGLYDMSGNVYEWCRNFYDKGVNMSKTLLDEEMVAQERAIRGGSYVNDKWSTEVGVRKGQQPREPAGDIGFRIIYYPN